MPKAPKRKTKIKRVACRYSISQLDKEYWAKAFDQSGKRYPEADILNPDRNIVVYLSRKRINDSFSAKKGAW